MSDRYIKEFTSIFKSLIERHSYWQVWADFCYMSAAAISNAVDKRHYEERENAYLAIVNRYQKDEVNRFPELFAITTNALEANPEQDFLGELYMQLGMGNHYKGQFFTTYPVARCMAELGIGDAETLIKEKGFITANDPCCGSGVLLIAYANALKERGINYQQSVMFTAQDIDPVVAMMCYVELALLGCAAEIRIGNSLTNEPVSSENRWFTPLYFHEVWHRRRVFGSLFGGGTASNQALDNQRKESANERTGKETSERLVSAQQRDEAHFWIFGGFAG